MTTATISGTADARATGPGPVRSVSLFSTGSVRIHPQQPFGSQLPMYAWLVGSRRWTPPRPINVYLIEHEQGLVLFDTGQDPSSVTDPGYFPGGLTGFLYGRLARFQIGPDDALPARLAAAGYAPPDVRLAILSHLHQDHVGGIPHLPDAEFVVSGAEWAALRAPAPELRGFLRSHIERPDRRFRRIEFAPTTDPALAPFTASCDVMGDGSLVLLPTPGHTPGSMSLLVRRPGAAPLLMVGDLAYEVEALEAGRVPGVGRRAELREASKMILALKERLPDLAILPAHDPGAAERLRRANDAPQGTGSVGHRR